MGCIDWVTGDDFRVVAFQGYIISLSLVKLSFQLI